MSTLRTARVLRSLAFAVLVSGLSHAGTVTVTSVVTPLGNLFQYNYTIGNATTDDLPDLDIAVTKGLSITGLVAPAGFTTAYDSGLGLVSFLENTSNFGAPLSGFIFDSSVGPNPTTFTANVLNLNTFNFDTPITGATQGPVTPEPATWTLVALAGAAMILYRLKRSFINV